MTHHGTMTIETARLRLRPFTIADAPAMFANWAADPEVTRFLSWPAHRDVSVTCQVLTGWTSRYGTADYYQWAITVKADGPQPVGSIGVVAQDDRVAAAEVGYCLGRPWWHRGIMSEALTAVIGFLSAEGYQRVTACHDTVNVRSGQVMRHCGMRLEGVLTQAGRNNRGVVDECLYAIVTGQAGPQPMRRGRQQLTAAECGTLLDQASSGVLALVGLDGHPYAVPLSFVYLDGCVWFHSALTGTKLAAIRRCPAASFCVIGQDDVHREAFTTHYRSVMITGQAFIEQDEQRRQAALSALAVKYGVADAASRRREVEAGLARAVIIRMEVEAMTGKQAKELVTADDR